jgi:hypothetical protein
MMRVRQFVAVVAVAVLAHWPTGPLVAQSAADSAAIITTSLDYIDGYYTGNAERMERSLHPELAKRIINTDERGRSRLDHMGAMRLVQGTRSGFGREETVKRTDVRILDIFQNTASVRIDAGTWVDYLHVAKFNGRWVIVNVLWEIRR